MCSRLTIFINSPRTRTAPKEMPQLRPAAGEESERCRPTQDGGFQRLKRRHGPGTRSETRSNDIRLIERFSRGEPSALPSPREQRQESVLGIVCGYGLWAVFADIARTGALRLTSMMQHVGSATYFVLLVSRRQLNVRCLPALEERSNTAYILE